MSSAAFSFLTALLCKLEFGLVVFILFMFLMGFSFCVCVCVWLVVRKCNIWLLLYFAICTSVCLKRQWYCAWCCVDVDWVPPACKRPLQFCYDSVPINVFRVSCLAFLASVMYISVYHIPYNCNYVVCGILSCLFLYFQSLVTKSKLFY